MTKKKSLSDIYISQRNWRLVASPYFTLLFPHKEKAQKMYARFARMRKPEKKCPHCFVVLSLGSKAEMRNLQHDPFWCLVHTIASADVIGRMKDPNQKSLLPEALNGHRLLYSSWAHFRLIEYALRELLK